LKYIAKTLNWLLKEKNFDKNMKYQKPQLKVITKSFAHAVCSSGSHAAPFEACQATGSNASGGCIANGFTAAVTNCQNGSSASFFGTSGCQIGIIPESTEECGTGGAV
jgi:hypothetical protein